MNHLKHMLGILLVLSLSAAAQTWTIIPGMDQSVRLGDPDVQVRVKLIHQEAFREDGAFAQGGTAKIQFYSPQPLPTDGRMRVYMGNGEFCTYESGTEWPERIAEGEWPVGDLLLAGDATFKVQSAPGDIVYDSYEGGFFREQPDAVKVDDFIHSYFFDGSYLPPGKPLSMNIAAGRDVGEWQVESSFPEDFSVQSPDIEGGTTIVDVGAELPITWTPSQSNTRMVVLVKDAFSFIKCDLIDDGEATIPFDAMNYLVGNQFSTISTQFWREKRLKTQVEDSTGKIVEVDLITRHVKFGRFASSRQIDTHILTTGYPSSILSSASIRRKHYAHAAKGPDRCSRHPLLSLCFSLCPPGLSLRPRYHHGH